MTTTFLMMLKLIINDLIILLFNNIPDNITSNKNGNQSNFEKKKNAWNELTLSNSLGRSFFIQKLSSRNKWSLLIK